MSKSSGRLAVELLDFLLDRPHHQHVSASAKILAWCDLIPRDCPPSVSVTPAAKLLEYSGGNEYYANYQQIVQIMDSKLKPSFLRRLIRRLTLLLISPASAALSHLLCSQNSTCLVSYGAQHRPSPSLPWVPVTGPYSPLDEQE